METETVEYNEEGWSDERLLIKRIWSRVYLDTEEKHIGLLKDYADQQCKAEREKAIDDAITVVTCNDFSLISQMVMALEKLKLKQP